MSLSSNVGILYAGNFDGSSSNATLPTASAVASSSLAFPGSFNVQVVQRIVLTCVWGIAGGGVTGYTIRARLTNNNTFGSLSGGVAPKATSGGSTDSDLNVAVPILSVAQNDSAPGFQQLDHTYTTGNRDLILVVGGLAGLFDVLITTTGAAPISGDFLKISADVF